MKVILFSIGTRGDIDPFLAIAQILRKAKCEVICVFPEQFSTEVHNLGIPFKGFTKEFLALLEGKDAKMYMGGQGSIFQRMRFLLRMVSKGYKLSKEMLAAQHRIQFEEAPDLVLYHPKCNYSLFWGMHRPHASIMVSPVPGVSHEIRHTTILGNYGPFLNLLITRFGNIMKAVTLRVAYQSYRKDYAGMKVSVASIYRSMLKEEKTLYTISPSLFPRPRYWPETAQILGHFESNKTTQWEPSEALVAFLKKHDKIIFISFGSMPNAQPLAKTSMMIEALQRNNIPAIINTSWGGLEAPAQYPESIFFVNNIPYEWIFPKVEAVIHHGGAGTTHNAIKHGCPCLIIPHALDQFFWSKVVSGLALGPKGIPMKQLNENTFETRLLALLNNQAYADNAKRISAHMAKESDEEKLLHTILQER